MLGAPPIMDNFIRPAMDYVCANETIWKKGGMGDYVNPALTRFKKVASSCEAIKDDSVALTKVCKLTAYSASVVAAATGYSQFGAKLVNFVTKSGDVVNASFLLAHVPQLVIEGLGLDRYAIGKLAMLTAEVGGWMLWLNSLGVITLTHTTTIVVITGVALCTAFAFIGYKAYNDMTGSKTPEEYNAAQWQTANAVSEVALHTLSTVGASLPVITTYRLFSAGVMALGTSAAVSAISHKLAKTELEEEEKRKKEAEKKPEQEKKETVETEDTKWVSELRPPEMSDFKKKFDYLHKATFKVTGVLRTSKFAVSLIGVAGIVSAVAEKKLAPLKSTLNTFKGAMVGVALLGRVNEWKDYEGKQGWRGWSTYKFFSRIGLTFGHAFKCAGFLDKAGLRQLGSFSRTAFGSFRVIDVLGDGSIIVSAVFSIADTVTKLYKAPDLEEFERVKKTNQDEREKWRKYYCDDTMPVTEEGLRAVRELGYTLSSSGGCWYYHGKHCTYKAKDICQNRASHFYDKQVNAEIQIEKASLNWRKNWMTIANEIAKISVISMAWITYGLGLGFAWQATVTIIGFFTNSTGLAKYVMGQEINEKNDNDKFEPRTLTPLIPVAA